jgi:uncharacterized membrane protein YvbJ
MCVVTVQFHYSSGDIQLVKCKIMDQLPMAELSTMCERGSPRTILNVKLNGWFHYLLFDDYDCYYRPTYFDYLNSYDPDDSF